MNIGDIHWVDLPGAGGRAQFGRRPAMVIQDEKYGGNLPTVIVVPLTSTQKALRFAGTTAIVATPESGLRNDSVALVFQCLAIDRSQVGQRVGNALQSECAAVLAELARLTGQ
ncbi:MAG: type II toxin-antitoxin system PemK/MazF family toxin [Pirellulaceae bacterium]|jgi:mRNA interferase MazF|nr:type II toxin-antitoxin system PemK/MazF family toxin [Pirellulaceae bacterium]